MAFWVLAHILATACMRRCRSPHGIDHISPCTRYWFTRVDLTTLLTRINSKPSGPTLRTLHRNIQTVFENSIKPLLGIFEFPSGTLQQIPACPMSSLSHFCLSSLRAAMHHFRTRFSHTGSPLTSSVLSVQILLLDIRERFVTSTLQMDKKIKLRRVLSWQQMALRSCN